MVLTDLQTIKIFVHSLFALIFKIFRTLILQLKIMFKHMTPLSANFCKFFHRKLHQSYIKKNICTENSTGLTFSVLAEEECLCSNISSREMVLLIIG